MGALSRLKGLVPDLALVIDNIAATKIKEARSARKCSIVGDIASTINPPVSDDLASEARRLEELAREKTVIMIVADHTANAIQLVKTVADSVRLEKDPNQFVISYSLVHPKLIGTEEGNRILGPASDLLEGLTVDQFGGLSTDARVVRSNITATAYSTVGRIALHHGKRFVSVWGREIEKIHLEENRRSGFSLTQEGVVPRLSGPHPFSSLDWERFDKAGRDWAQQAKFQPEAAIRSMRELV